MKRVKKGGECGAQLGIHTCLLTEVMGNQACLQLNGDRKGGGASRYKEPDNQKDPIEDFEEARPAIIDESYGVDVEVWRECFTESLISFAEKLWNENGIEESDGEADLDRIEYLLGLNIALEMSDDIIDNIRTELMVLRRFFRFYMLQDTEKITNATILSYHIQYILLRLHKEDEAEVRALEGIGEHGFETMDQKNAMEKERDDAEKNLAYARINQLEIQAGEITRKDFFPELKDVLSVGGMQDRCHTISNAYIKAGVFTPILNAAAALIRYMAWREETLPEEGYAVNLKKALLGILFAVFPDGGGWQAEDERLAELSLRYFYNAQILILNIEADFAALSMRMKNRLVAEFDMPAMQRIVWTGEELYNVLNNSPQNLRIGDSSTNSSIQEGLDIPLNDIEEWKTDQVDYADDLADLYKKSGTISGKEVHRVICGSMTHKALLALLVLAKLGDSEIETYSGILPETKKSTMQSSDLRGVLENNLEPDTESLIVSLRDIPEDLDPEFAAELDDYEENEEDEKLVDYFQFTREDGKYKPVIPQRRITPPLGWEQLTAEEQKRRVVRRLQADVVREQLQRENLHLVAHRENGTGRTNDCFFTAISEQLNEQLMEQGLPIQDFRTLKTGVRRRIENKKDFITLDNGEGVKVLDALVEQLGGNLNVHLTVTEPQDYDYATGIIGFGHINIDSTMIPGALVILLHIYFNGYNHYMDIENISQEEGEQAPM